MKYRISAILQDDVCIGFIYVGGVYMDMGANKSGHHWKDMAKRGSLFNFYWELTFIGKQCECNLVLLVED